MNDAASLALYAMMLVLPVAALVARRMALRSLIVMALAWVAIFGIGYLLLSTIWH